MIYIEYQKFTVDWDEAIQSQIFDNIDEAVNAIAEMYVNIDTWGNPDRLYKVVNDQVKILALHELGPDIAEEGNIRLKEAYLKRVNFCMSECEKKNKIILENREKEKDKNERELYEQLKKKFETK